MTENNDGSDDTPDDNSEPATPLRLKTRFLSAVVSGELGRLDENGAIVTMREFKQYFADIKTQYSGSFLPSVTIEIGQHTATRTHYVFRVRKGVYRVHPDAIQAHIQEYGIKPPNQIRESPQDYDGWNDGGTDYMEV